MMYIPLWIGVLFFISKALQQCDCTKEALFRRRAGKYLANYVIHTETVENEFNCVTYCVDHITCASVNYKTSGNDKGLCELNSEAIDDSTNEGTDNSEYDYLEKVRKIFNPRQLVGLQGRV